MIPYVQLFFLLTLFLLTYVGSMSPAARLLIRPPEASPLSTGNDSQEYQRRNNVQDYVRKHDLPLSGIDEKGAYFFLHHIDPDNKPVYVRTHHQPGAKAGYRHQNLYLASLHKSYRPETTWTAAPNMLSFRKVNTEMIVLRSAQPMSMITIVNTEGKLILRREEDLNDTVTLNMNAMQPDTYFISIRTTQGNEFCLLQLC